MHILDLIMYFVCGWLLWQTLRIISGGDFTEEIGSLVGYMAMIIFTIVYIILFCFYPDWNWSDLSWAEVKSWFNFNFHLQW